jgi:hypothetical protein
VEGRSGDPKPHCHSTSRQATRLKYYIDFRPLEPTARASAEFWMRCSPRSRLSPQARGVSEERHCRPRLHEARSRSLAGSGPTTA